jgi:hypothetical protein
MTRPKTFFSTRAQGFWAAAVSRGVTPIASAGLLGLGYAEAQFSRSASNLARMSLNGGRADSVAGDVVSMQVAKAETAASVQVLHTADAIQKSLLDIFA